jgi:hypothetical protein
MRWNTKLFEPRSGGRDSRALSVFRFNGFPPDVSNGTLGTLGDLRHRVRLGASSRLWRGIEKTRWWYSILPFSFTGG